jgi:hypothetical protein
MAFAFVKDVVKNNRTKSAKPRKTIKTKESASA